MAVQSALESLVETMTLRQLADQTGRSVNDVVAWAMGKRVSAPKMAATAKAPAAAKVSGKVDVRNAAGRTAYDKAVLELLTSVGDPTSAQHIRAQLGGTPTQMRASLNRLIERKKVGYQGRARAMRYFVK